MINLSITPRFRYLALFAAIIYMLAVPAQQLMAQSSYSNDVTARDYQGYNRYVLSSNSLGIEQGRFIYNNFMVFVNSLSYGITDNISFTAGFIPAFSSILKLPFTSNLKSRYPFNRTGLTYRAGFTSSALLKEARIRWGV
ncbi:MAG: hypothetical protein LAT84_06565 [Balneolia bacterium]|nr:hypothetical protein [Balneolia bacterium]